MKEKTEDDLVIRKTESSYFMLRDKMDENPRFGKLCNKKFDNSRKLFGKEFGNL